MSNDIDMRLGDCLEVLPALDVTRIDAVITDPPYGANVLMHHGRTGDRLPERYVGIVGDADDSVGLAMIGWADEAGLPLVAFAQPRRPWPGAWAEWLVWDKGPAVGGGGDYRRTHKRTWELIQCRRCSLHAGRGEAVLRHHVGPGGRLHIAEKPVSLMRQLVRQFCPPGGTVLDPFFGSGSTAVACVLEGRRFVGVEKDPGHFAAAVRRVEAARGEAA